MSTEQAIEPEDGRAEIEARLAAPHRRFAVQMEAGLRCGRMMFFRDHVHAIL